ncbi:coproporphyrinogen III oxidase [Paenactinomyces guangxiensis]|uniref:Coproporphyrinogen III oxidase n=2 Tax=Paenactinomyces guangxiensis TaxID=1490290 RepID=A0A7W1WRB4_9BACL|nr:coproporphyrinogen III oxidase [Paenactinomyces guangxiensis]MBH8591736.1 coproporphyrinogen III oxidase [Paenactinomyces guangxiensis]
MINIYVSGVDPVFYRDIELISALFFEDVKVTDESGTGDFSLHFTIEGGNPIGVSVTLTDPNKMQQWHASHQRAVKSDEQGKEYRKRVKQAVSHALLQVLQESTGIRQPWGILTGVRPTKLLHTLLLDGKPMEEAEQILIRDYQLHPEKIELLKEIIHRQTTVIPDLYELNKEVSLYIGIPFCPTKCAYCTFPAYAIQGRTGSVEGFLAGLHEEIEAVGEWLKERNLPVTTIYFGGGTPTSITANQMDSLFKKMKNSIPSYGRVRELTVEAGRPDTLDEEKLDLLKRWKVDRISINPQSFKEETLKLIGRHHTVKETLEKYKLARRMGLNNINMDLIIGLPNEGPDTFRQSLDVMEELRPESLTVHTLSFKRGSVMTQNKQKYTVADRDETGEMVRLAREWAKKMGYVPYYLYRQKNILGNQENVGYAFPGEESLYNIIIMEERQTIIGLGCGAVSKIISPMTGRIKRWPNPKEPQAYINTYRRHLTGKLKVLDEAYGAEVCKI